MKKITVSAQQQNLLRANTYANAGAPQLGIEDWTARPICPRINDCQAVLVTEGDEVRFECRACCRP